MVAFNQYENATLISSYDLSEALQVLQRLQQAAETQEQPSRLPSGPGVYDAHAHHVEMMQVQMGARLQQACSDSN
jgi:hypothetical protein